MITDRQLRKARRRVARGAEYLQYRYGNDWASKIDPLSLDTGSPRQCPLAQVSGTSYFNEVPSWRTVWATRMGFESSTDGFYDALDVAWKERLVTNAPPPKVLVSV